MDITTLRYRYDCQRGCPVIAYIDRFRNCRIEVFDYDLSRRGIGQHQLTLPFGDGKLEVEVAVRIYTGN